MLLNIKFKIIVILISVPFLIYFWPLSFGGDTEFLIVQGNSMLPTIKDGSLVITKKQPSYEIEDIVSFTLKEGSIQRIVVHRIIDETEEGFKIKGDNNAKKDTGFWTEKDIHGKVLFATPYFGELLQYLRNPVVFFFTAIVTVVIQLVQKNRRKMKEKLRRIRLGLPPKSEKRTIQEQKKKTTKSDYSLLFIALFFNILTYILIQISIVDHLIPIRDMGDSMTGFLFKMFASSFASTVAFAVYMVFILGLYFLTKYYETKISKSKTSTNKRSGPFLQLLGKQFNPMLAVAQFFWFLFIILSLFHLISIGGGMIESITNPCDPTKALC